MNKWAEENTAEPVKGYENSTTYKYKCKSQGWKTRNYNTVIQICCIYKTCPKSAQIVSKCRDDEEQMSKIANLPKTANDLGWHSCLPKFHLTKCGLDSLYILF